MLHSFKFQKIALATASLLAIGSYQASAQDATINISGQITASTCGLALALVQRPQLLMFPFCCALNKLSP